MANLSFQKGRVEVLIMMGMSYFLSRFELEALG
jgi:hypothetical protein